MWVPQRIMLSGGMLIASDSNFVEASQRYFVPEWMSAVQRIMVVLLEEVTHIDVTWS